MSDTGVDDAVGEQKPHYDIRVPKVAPSTTSPTADGSNHVLAIGAEKDTDGIRVTSKRHVSIDAVKNAGLRSEETSMFSGKEIKIGAFKPEKNEENNGEENNSEENNSEENKDEENKDEENKDEENKDEENKEGESAEAEETHIKALDEAHKQFEEAEEDFEKMEDIVFGFNMAVTGLKTLYGVMTTKKTVASGLKTAFSAAKSAASAASTVKKKVEGSSPEGGLFVHADGNIETSSGKKIVNYAAKKFEAISSRVVEFTAGTKFEVNTGGVIDMLAPVTEISGLISAGITGAFSAELTSTYGEAEVAGRTVKIGRGNEAALVNPIKASPTSCIEMVATDAVAIDANLRVEDDVTINGTLRVPGEKVFLAESKGAYMSMSGGGLQLGVSPVAETASTTFEKACKAAEEAKEEAVKVAEAAKKTGAPIVKSITSIIATGLKTFDPNEPVPPAVIHSGAIAAQMATEAVVAKVEAGADLAAEEAVEVANKAFDTALEGISPFTSRASININNQGDITLEATKTLTLRVGNNKLVISDRGIEITATEIKIKAADNSLTVTGQGVKLSTDANKLNVSNSGVKINNQAISVM